MASLTSVLNLIKEKDSSETRAAQAVTPTKAQPEFKDYSLGTTPAGGLDTIKKYYGTLGQQGQKSEQRRLEQAGLSNIVDETNRTNSRNFALKREQSRGPTTDLILKQSLLDEALAKIQNYIKPEEGTPEVLYQEAVPELRTAAEGYTNDPYETFLSLQLPDRYRTKQDQLTQAAAEGLFLPDRQSLFQHTFQAEGENPETTVDFSPLQRLNQQITVNEQQLSNYQNLADQEFAAPYISDYQQLIRLLNEVKNTPYQLQPNAVVRPAIPEVPFQPAIPGLPGSPYSLSDVEKEAEGYQGQLGGLNDILGNIADKYKPIEKQFDFSRFNLTDPLQSPGRPEENFLRRNLKGAVVSPKAK